MNQDRHTKAGDLLRSCKGHVVRTPGQKCRVAKLEGACCIAAAGSMQSLGGDRPKE
jgi:hypothetical protein